MAVDFGKCNKVIFATVYADVIYVLDHDIALAGT